jgi:glycosyltransferase involved in cell wall biosynthesis
MKLALFWASGHIESSTGTYNLAVALARAGCDVDVYTARNRTSLDPQFGEPRIRTFFLPGIEPDLKEPVMRLTTRFTLWVLKSIRRGDYDGVIGAGIRGMVAAAVVRKRQEVPAAQLSLELYPSWQRPGLRARVLKMVERWANRQMRINIVQDSQRADLLLRDNHISPASVVLMPVAPLGPARIENSRLLAERFHLEGKRILLYAGALFAPFTVTEELVRAAQDWPDDLVLVVHASQVNPPEKFTALEALDPRRRVVLSREPLPYAQIREVMGSAAIGLVLYKPTDDSFYYTGMSSGKLAEFLRCGVPCIVSDLPGPRDLAANDGIGEVVKSFDEIPAAARRILADYPGFRERAIRCFDARLAAERFVPDVIEAFERCRAQP